MRNRLSFRWLAVVAAFTLVGGIAWAGPVDAQDGSVEGTVMTLFDGFPDTGRAALVLKDAGETTYWAFYLATYMEVRELRAYRIPFSNVDVGQIDAALESGDHAEAFELLLHGMRLDLGAKYVSDVNLDGINDEVVPLGSGTMRDRFHHELFSGVDDADAAYRSWLGRALEVKGAGTS